MAVLERKESKGLEELQAVLHNAKALQKLREIGVRTALVVTRDGFLIDGVVCNDEQLDLETLAVNAAYAFQVADSRQDRFSWGQVTGIIGEFENGGALIVDPVGDDVLVAFIAESGTDPGSLRTELRRLTSNLAAAREPGAPAVTKSTDTGVAPSRATVGPSPKAKSSGRQESVRAQQAEDSPTDKGVGGTKGPRRIILKEVRLDPHGFAATATVELVHDGRAVIGKAVGRNNPEQSMSLAAEAAVRAVTELLPPEHGVVLESIQAISSGEDNALWVKVLLVTPSEGHSLLGIARIDPDVPSAAAKSVLNALNRRIDLVLNQRR